MLDKPRELEDLSQSKLEGRNRTEFFDPPLCFDSEPVDPVTAEACHSGRIDFYMNTEIFPRFRLDEVPHPKRD